MNAKAIALCALFCVFGLVALAQDSRKTTSDIPGGIVYSNGKDAIFLEFKTGKKLNLTSDQKDIVFKPPFAISENGKKLLWLQNSRFCAKELPLGSPHTVQAETMKITKIVRDPNSPNPKSINKKANGKEDIVWQREVKNLSISPDGTRFAFEAIHAAPGWIMLDEGNPKSIARLMASGAYANFRASDPTKDDPRFRLLPLYVKRTDSFNGIFYLSVIDNIYDPPSADPFSPAFGSLVENPPVAMFKATSEDILGKSVPGIKRPLGHGLIGQWAIGGERLGDSFGGNAPESGKIDDSITVKKNACFLTFQKNQAWESGNKKAAFIYQIGNQWGPIEIKTLDSKKSNGGLDYNKTVSFQKNLVPKNYTGKARELEIQAMFPEVIGLAWRPDESLSVFTSQGDVYLVEGAEIQKGFEASSMDLRKNQHDRKQVTPVSINNILRTKPQLVAKGILGTCFNWVSDYSLLYLDQGNNVCLWTNGKTEKITDSTGYFFYCSLSPFDGVSNPEALIADKTSDGYPPSLRGKKKASEGTPLLHNTADRSEDSIINFGPIQTIWKDVIKNDSLRISLKAFGKPLQFALIEDEGNLDNIKDPCQYEYLSGQLRRTSVLDKSAENTRTLQRQQKGFGKDRNLSSHSEIITSEDVLMPVGAIVILNLDTAYLAIKPVSLNLKYHSVNELPEWAKKSWAKDVAKGIVPPIHDSMSYEWKYWPKATPQKGTVAKKPTEKDSWEISAIPIGKEFYIGNTKFFWEEISEAEKRAPGRKAIFTIKFSVDKADQDEHVGRASDWTRITVSNPSNYEFSDYRKYGVGGKVPQICGFEWIEKFILILKIGNRYIAIEPVEERRGWVQYKWKYWPDVSPPAELAKTALN